MLSTGFFYAHSMQTSSSTELLPFKLNCIAVCVTGQRERRERVLRGGEKVGNVDANSSSRGCFSFALVTLGLAYGVFLVACPTKVE